MGRLSPAALAAAILVTVPSAALASDYADTARNIVPSGQWGGAPVPAGADVQARMYDSLTPRFDQVTAGDLGGALGPQLAELKAVEGTDNAPRTGFTGGGINYVDKDLRALLGTRFKNPFKTRFCGGGNIVACRTAVWSALDAAGADVAAKQGTDDPNAWRTDARPERIKFQPGLLPTTIRYTNRPSGIQQVISFGGHRAGRR
jgi:hypothetical protein